MEEAFLMARHRWSSVFIRGFSFSAPCAISREYIPGMVALISTNDKVFQTMEFAWP